MKNSRKSNYINTPSILFNSIKNNNRPLDIIPRNTNRAVLVSLENLSISKKIGYGLIKILCKKADYTLITVNESINQDMENKIFEFIKDRRIDILIDIDFKCLKDDSIIEVNNNILGMWDEELKKAICYSFEYQYRNSLLKNIVIHGDMKKSRLMNIANYNTKYLYLGINELNCDLKDMDTLNLLYKALLDTFLMFGNIDWKAKYIKTYKLKQCKIHKPQDKVEIKNCSNFENNGLINVCSYNYTQRARVHQNSTISKNDDIYLTNRLIELLFDRDWLEVSEEKSQLEDAPIIIYENSKEKYKIGLPKADKIDGIYFSTGLYNKKKIDFDKYDYAIYNRYSDSILYIDISKANYEDYGRIKKERVMIPRYYKRILGYLDYPLKMIRAEEYSILKEKLEKNKFDYFEKCYEKINGEAFYKLKDKYNSLDEDEVLPEKEKLIEIQEELEMYTSVEILRFPKKNKRRDIKKNLSKSITNVVKKIRNKILDIIIGKSEYVLKTEWTNETDDKNNVARLSINMMNLLGVLENDKIIIKFGNKHEIVRILADENMTDYQIGVPAMIRKKMEMNSVNDIVFVHRDMWHIFCRHSEGEIIALFGTILTFYQTPLLQHLSGILSIVLLIVAIIGMFCFSLNEERIKVK